MEEKVVTRDDAGNQRTTVRKTSASAGASSTAARVVWFIGGVIIILLLFRITLLLLAANDTAGFVNFVYTLSSIFAAPFFGIFSYEPQYQQSVLELSSVVAIAVYTIVAWGIARLLTLNKPRTDEI